MSPSTCSGSRTLARTMPQQILVHAAFPRQGHDRNGEALLVHLPPIRPHAQSADVNDMDGVGEQAHRLAPVEAGADHRDVVQMTRGEPRIIGDVVVAGLHGGERVDREEMLHRIGHRIDVSRRAGDRLRQHAAVAVEHARREVARLAHRGAERRPQHGLRLLLDHGDQPVPHDLGLDLRERGVGACDHDLDPVWRFRSPHHLAASDCGLLNQSHTRPISCSVRHFRKVLHNDANFGSDTSAD